MEWSIFLTEFIKICVIPLLGLLTTYFINFIKIKSNEIMLKIENDTADKYVALLTDTISACVLATNQTYVETLKKENAFTAEAQKIAFEKTYNAIMAILSEDAKKYFISMYGDLNAYLITKIEAEVQLNK